MQFSMVLQTEDLVLFHISRKFKKVLFAFTDFAYNLYYYVSHYATSFQKQAFVLVVFCLTVCVILQYTYYTTKECTAQD